MSQILRHPRLPEGRVTLALVSGEYPWLGAALAGWGIDSISTQGDSRLPFPVRFHPDLQVCPLLRKQMFVFPESSLAEALRLANYTVRETRQVPAPVYPHDVLCGGFPWGRYLVGNPKTLDMAILTAAQSLGLRSLPVHQGYAACSVALVNEHSAITADKGMQKVLEAEGFQVLSIQPGFIQLPGYDTGFIGGCCGKLAPDTLAFTGSLSSQPDGERISAFLQARGVHALELREGPLLDVGGILPLKEKEKPV